MTLLEKIFLVFSIVFFPLYLTASEIDTLPFNLSSSDGSRIAYQCFSPSNTPKASIIIIHGYGEHRGRYRHLVDELLRLDLEVYTFDLRGHGESSGERGHINNFMEYLDDLEAVYRQIKNKYSEKEIFVFGHSMGGLVAISGILEKRFIFSAVILSSPLLGFAHVSWMKTVAALFLFAIKPDLTVNTGVKNEQLSFCKETCEKRSKDSLNHQKTTPAWFRETKNQLKAVSKGDKSLFTMPILMQLAEYDFIVDNRCSCSWFDHLPANTEKEKITHQGFFHEIYQGEKNYEPIFCLVNWLKERLIDFRKFADHS